MIWVPAAEDWKADVQPLFTLPFAGPELLELLKRWPPTAEQLATAAQHLRGSDVWGLGAVLYCAVTREAPFGPSKDSCALQEHTGRRRPRQGEAVLLHGQPAAAATSSCILTLCYNRAD